MSLRWRILTSSIFVVVLTALLTIGVGYWTTQRRLAEFTAEIGAEEAQFLSQFLSKEYTTSGGWDSLERALFDAGYLFDEALLIEELQLSAEEASQIYFPQPSRVVVVDITDQVLIDSFGHLSAGAQPVALNGKQSPIFDPQTLQAIGTVYVEFSPDFLVNESTVFLSETLYTTAIGGLITAFIVSLLAAWFAERITAPVTALTHATLALAAQKETQLLPVTSNDELGQMSMAFNKMTLGLQTQRDLRKRLINDVSHELNTPLSVIQLEAKGLNDGLQTPQEAAGQIIQEIDLLRNLVHDLNWLAETDSGELRLNLEGCDLAQLLTAEVDRWQTQAQSQEITLFLEAVPPLPVLQLDTMRMSQVLGNVIRNALQHTKKNGRITVTAALHTATETNLSCVTITVADNGIGIDSAELPHIFNRFYRTDLSRSKTTGGRGLGLAITQAIVEAHNGTVSATSSGIGRGTIIQIELPV